MQRLMRPIHRTSTKPPSRFGRGALALAFMFAACGSGGSDSPDGGAADAATRPPDCTVEAPTACPTPAVKYGDIAPIIQTHCVTCHNGNGQEWPLTTYTHVADWTSEVRAAVLDCSMPPPDAGTVISDEERLAILTWVRCGVPK